MGFIAQEANEVIPEVVDYSGELYSMQYAPITALLVEALKEQNDLIKTQEKRLIKLEQEKIELENRLTKIESLFAEKILISTKN